MKNNITICTTLSLLSLSSPILSLGYISHNKNPHNQTAQTIINNNNIHNFKTLFKNFKHESHNIKGNNEWTPWPTNVDGFQHPWAYNLGLHKGKGAPNNPFFNYYYNRLSSIKMYPIKTTANEQLSKQLQSFNIKYLIDLGLAIGSLITDAIGLPTEGITINCFVAVAFDLAALASFAANAMIKGKSGTEYTVKDIRNDLKNLRNLTNHSNNLHTIQAKFSNNPQSNEAMPQSPHNWDCIQDEVSLRRFDENNSNAGNISITNTYTYNTGVSYKVSDYPVTYYGWKWDKSFRSVGYTTRPGDIKKMFDIDGDKDKSSYKKYVFEAANSAEDSDGILYFSPSTMKHYNDQPLIDNQTKDYLYTEPTIKWNPNKKNGFYQVKVSNSSEYRSQYVSAIIAPSIFGQVLSRADATINGTSTYSYDSDYNSGGSRNNYDNMGNINITINNTTISDTYKDKSSNDTLFHPGLGKYTTISHMSNGSPNRTNGTCGDASLPGESGALPIRNTKLNSDHNYQIWCSDWVGQHQWDIPVAFKVVNMDPAWEVVK